jgi:hypothetical protein
VAIHGTRRTSRQPDPLPVKRATVSGGRARSRSFSLAEVVIALGVITVGIVAVLGVFPAALQTGHSAQDETRAAHIAQSVFGSLVAQAPSQFSAVRIRLSDGVTLSQPPLDLTQAPCTTPPTPSLTLYANNDGKLTQDATTATYAIFIFTCNSSCLNCPNGFTDPASANEVTVRVLWPPIPAQGPTPAPNQTYRDYVRIVSKY